MNGVACYVAVFGYQWDPSSPASITASGTVRCTPEVVRRQEHLANFGTGQYRVSFANRSNPLEIAENRPTEEKNRGGREAGTGPASCPKRAIPAADHFYKAKNCPNRHSVLPESWRVPDRCADLAGCDGSGCRLGLCRGRKVFVAGCAGLRLKCAFVGRGWIRACGPVTNPTHRRPTS